MDILLTPNWCYNFLVDLESTLWNLWRIAHFWWGQGLEVITKQFLLLSARLPSSQLWVMGEITCTFLSFHFLWKIRHASLRRFFFFFSFLYFIPIGTRENFKCSSKKLFSWFWCISLSTIHAHTHSHCLLVERNLCSTVHIPKWSQCLFPEDDISVSDRK